MRGRRVLVAAVVALACLGTTASAAAAPTPGPTPLSQWLAMSVVEIAHRGGDADWPEASPLAYLQATAWNPSLALEFSARRTADGVWVASEDATTGRVFGTNRTIATSTWAQLSTLRSTVGGQPMSRLDRTVLQQVPTSRILFVDDKDDAHVDELLDLLDRYGGRKRTVIKSYYSAVATPAAARARGYATWGYYYERNMTDFAKTQGKFDLLGMQFDASAATWSTLRATGKRLFAHIVATPAQAAAGRAAGATGLMVSGVKEIVPKA